MTDDAKPVYGAIVWTDLTVPDAEALRAFYSAVAGWRSEPVSMGDYDDFNMLTKDSDRPVAGICHTRGSNASLPAHWLVYVAVEDLDGSLRECRRLGGRVVDGPRPMGKKRFCVIQDPAGVYAGLIEA